MSLVKRKPYRNRKILQAAKGEICTLGFMEVCTGGGPDTVAAHSNYGEDGKGAGQKADDCFVAFACKACHDAYDGRTPDLKNTANWLIKERFHVGMKKTLRRLLDRGILK